MKTIASLAFVSCVVLACGPTVSNDGDDTGDDDGRPDSGPCVASGEETTEAACSDLADNDCDGRYDCSDPECSGVGDCPVCGEVQTSAGAGIVLPDGIIGAACTTDASCAAATPNCVEMECHASYTSTLDVIGFGDNQTFDTVDLIESVCVTMEHSWLRDLEIRLIAPGGQIVRLQRFLGRTGGEVYMAQANDCDEGAPVAGTGAMYCWKPTATNLPMLDYVNGGGATNAVTSCNGFTSQSLPPGDYAAADEWESLIGTPLNGTWRFVVTDLWPIDNGFLFDWTIRFNPDAVTDCSGPIVD